MTIFRGPTQGTLPDGSVIATSKDIEEALNLAQQAQGGAEAALDNFNDRYLGAKTSDPATDNDGDPLIDGALYYNTTDVITRVYDVSEGTWSDLKPSATDQANINALGPVASQVEIVGDNIASVTAVVTDIADVNTVAGISTDITTAVTLESEIVDVSQSTDAVDIIASDLAGAGFDYDLGTITAVTEGVLGTPNGYIISLFNIRDEIVSVGDNDANVTTVADNIADVSTVATDLSGTDTIGTVATDIANVNTVAGISSDVSTVVGIGTDLSTVASIDTDVTTVSGISTDVSTVSGISTDVTTVAEDGTDIGTVATNIANVNTVAGISTDITTVSNISSNVTTVTGISTDVTTVAGIGADVTTVSGISSDVTTVSGVSSDVSTVAGISSDVTTVATNLSDITNFSDVYLGAAASDPATRNDSSPLQAGDIYFNTTNDRLKVYDGSVWAATTADSASIRSLFSAGGDLSYNSTTGEFSISIGQDVGTTADVTFNSVTADEIDCGSI